MKPTKPVVTVKAGAVRIPIFQHPQGGWQARFTDSDGTPMRWTGRDLDQLKERCRTKARGMQRGTVDLTELSADQLVVVREVLRREITLADLDAVATVRRVTLREAVDQLVEAKTDTSTNHRRTLRTHLNQLCKSFGKRPLSSLTTEELDRYLRKTANLRTRRNKRASIVTLWRWARDKGYLAQATRTAAERTDSPSLRTQKRQHTVETWTPDELKTILENVAPAYLNWIVLSAFAGIRTLELFPDEKDPENRKDVLQWEHIYLTGKEQRILVPAAVSKTAEKRSIPLSGTLRTWLLLTQSRVGPICNVPVPWKARKAHGGTSVINDLEAALSRPWRKNALRHSYGTYRVLEIGNIGPVALEMGNSERMVRAHYHDAGRTAQEATEWFSLSADKVERLRVA